MNFVGFAELPSTCLPSVQVNAFYSNGVRMYKTPLTFLVVNDDKIRVDELFKYMGQHLRYQSPDGIVVGSDSDGAGGFSNLPFRAGSVVDIYCRNPITEDAIEWWNLQGRLIFIKCFYWFHDLIGSEKVNKED